MSGKHIVCPKCGRYLKFNTEICEKCGFSFKELFEKADSRMKQMQDTIDLLEQSLEKGDRLTAYKCLGKLELLEDPKLHLRSAEVLMRDGEYEAADEQLMFYTYEEGKNPEDLSYSTKEKEAIPYELENLALSGQLTLFMITAAGGAAEYIDWYQLLWYQQLAYDNVPDADLKDYLEIKEMSKGPRVIRKNEKSDPMYKMLYFQHFCLDMIEMINFKEDYLKAIDRDPALKDSLVLLNRFKKNANKLVLSPIMREDGDNPVDRIFKASLDEIKSESFLEYIDEVIGAILFDDDVNPMAEDFSNFEIYFQCIENLGAMKIYQKYAEEYFNRLMEFYPVEKEKINHIIGTAYYEAINSGRKIKPKLARFVNENTENLKSEQDEGTERRIQRILSDKAYTAYEVAEWEFAQSKQYEYGWRDAGPISLSFFRIIELELNLKFVIPLINKCDIKALNDIYEADLAAMTRNSSKYRKAWKKSIRELKKIADKAEEVNGLQLGSLKELFDNIILFEDTELVKFVLSQLYSEDDKCILTKNGYSALLDGQLAEIISDSNRIRYRNPPAHTRFLPYSVAKECRDFVRKSILHFGEWFEMR